jgi:DNA-directed RNA polymerase subunit RPC12/RpoP
MRIEPINTDIYYEIKYVINDQNLDIETKLGKIKLIINDFKPIKTQRELVKCLRCGWQWFPLKEPVMSCPHCQSRKWNIPKKEGVKNEF